MPPVVGYCAVSGQFDAGAASLLAIFCLWLFAANLLYTVTLGPDAPVSAQAFVRDPNIVQFIIDEGIRFVTTSAGDPMKYTGMLKEAGLTVFHVVPSLAGALRAIEAGDDGLIVEGGEGGGFKNPKDVASMVLNPPIPEAMNTPTRGAGSAELLLSSDLGHCACLARLAVF